MQASAVGVAVQAWSHEQASDVAPIVANVNHKGRTENIKSNVWVRQGRGGETSLCVHTATGIPRGSCQLLLA